jgi:hypothetical protein
MKALMITPGDENELNFLTELFKRLGIKCSEVMKDDVQEAEPSKVLPDHNQTKEVIRNEIKKKLSR